ncbi:hypothetical protein ROHU_003462 [Labeo rohita]|uniref:SCAN box domain-containing protein n=1 Tax=Labeo rohita TaxID=84645 RepID=A0A498NUM1_LABRO|nr:hypothetical protein ROHU_003474 [Labeo rohita]RXN35862.1 hypothetical protein ROHU_003462 [Labeo rohita]
MRRRLRTTQSFYISLETYRQWFRATTTPAGESPIETYHHLKTQYHRWARLEQSMKREIGEIIMLKQLLQVLPCETWTWMKEHEPMSGLAAAKLAQQYMHTHRVSSHRSQPFKDECDAAFQNLKSRLCIRSILRSQDFSQQFLVQKDVLAIGLRAVLAQWSSGEERPVVFSIRKLLPREQRYLTIEKECLAIKWALESLRYYLLRREFDLETDHRALSWINTMKDHNARVSQ